MVSALKVEKLTVTLENQIIIRDISFNLDEGEIAALIGPNGAGKSILLKTLIGNFNYEGKIEIFEQDHFKSLHLIGYLPQYFYLDPVLPLTVMDFFSINLIPKEKINEIIDFLNIKSLRYKKMSQLSGGQLERVLFARSLASEPKILLLDEPISETDAEGQKEFYEIIVNLAQEKKTTIILVSHEIHLVLHIAQRIMGLNHTLVYDTKSKEISEKDILEKLYGHNIKFFQDNANN